MVNLQKYQNKKIAIYGMGLTGCSAAKTLKKLGAKIFCWDDNKKTRRRIKNLKFPLNKFWLNKNFVDNIVISPGIDISKCKIKSYLKKNSIHLIKKSSFYETPSYPSVKNPKFLNLVIEVRTDLSAIMLMKKLLKIEKYLGRKRSKKNSPRICDLDILDYKKKIIKKCKSE